MGLLTKAFLRDGGTYCNINFSSSLNNGRFSDTSQNLPIPPSNLKYSDNSFLLSTGVNINLTPTYQGTVQSCSANPNLPLGLTISSTTCAISSSISIPQGAPTIQSLLLIHLDTPLRI